MVKRKCFGKMEIHLESNLKIICAYQEGLEYCSVTRALLRTSILPPSGEMRAMCLRSETSPTLEPSETNVNGSLDQIKQHEKESHQLFKCRGFSFFSFFYCIIVQYLWHHWSLQRMADLHSMCKYSLPLPPRFLYSGQNYIMTHAEEKEVHAVYEIIHCWRKYL